MSQQDIDRHHAAAHAMQTGVRFDQEVRHSDDGSPKHLRVGINAAMSDHAGLAALLIAKGVITLDEYQKAIADQMESEQRLYEERLGVKLA